MMKASIGISSGTDSYAAGVDACQEAHMKLGEDPKLSIVFASSIYDQAQVLSGVRSVAKDALVIGSSTAGEITTAGPAKKHSVAVMLIASDTAFFYGAAAEKKETETLFEAGSEVARAVAAQSSDPLKLFVMIPDVLVGNGADAVRGVLAALGEHFPVVGGASGDDFKFEKTFQYFNDTAYTGSVVGLGIAGEFSFGIGVKHGWVPVGMPKRVTKSEGSVLHELDGKPAISVYEEYFGEKEAAELREKTLAQLAITYPLGMVVEGSEEMLIRDPISVDERGSITCAAEIPEGSEIRLMVGSKEEAVQVAQQAARYAVEQLEGRPPKAVIIFNCIARNKLFGDRSGEEIAAIQKEVGADTPLIGFYTYGEQAPLGGEVRNIEKCNPVFHNETVVILVLGE